MPSVVGVLGTGEPRTVLGSEQEVADSGRGSDSARFSFMWLGGRRPSLTIHMKKEESSKTFQTYQALASLLVLYELWSVVGSGTGAPAPKPQ